MSVQQITSALTNRLAQVGTYFKAAPTDHVRIFYGSKKVAEGLGLAKIVFFWNTIELIPTSDQSVSVMLTAPSKDRQRVRMQGSVVVRLDPQVVAGRRNFTIDPLTGKYRTEDFYKLLSEISVLLQEPLRAAVAKLDLEECLIGIETVKRDALVGIDNMRQTFADLGVTVVSLSMSDIRPEDTVLLQALEAPFRERTQQKADDAVAVRRKAQAEHDRELSMQRLETEKQEAEKRAAVIEVEGANKLLEAKHDAEVVGVKLAALKDEDTQRLMAMAYGDIAKNPSLKSVTLTPDLLSSIAKAQTPSAS